ncbi:flagellar biosynthesis/type III secretory pathway ATPase [Ewingella americana]
MNASDALDSWYQQRSQALGAVSAVTASGKITGINGILLESSLPQARIGDLCRVSRSGDEEMMAEVVGFNPHHTLLSALGPLDGVAQGAKVVPLFQPHSIAVSEALLGSVLDGFGRAIDEESISAFALSSEHPNATPVLGDAPSPTDRPRIDTALTTGIRAIDGLLTIGVGQRVGVFAGAGCGKTTLLAELARNTPCDAIVFGADWRTWPRAARIPRPRAGRRAAQPHRAGLLHLGP